MRMSRTRKSRLAIALGTATMIASMSVGAVMAGEITGNGKPTGTQGASWCRFSGQNDQVVGEGPVGPRSQSYGQELKLGLVPPPSITKGGAPSPGTMCNPNKTLLPPLK
jgi:hypothetical protein